MTERLRRILRRLPTWFKMRYDANTIGQQLLTAAAQPLEMAEAEAANAKRDYHLGSADEGRPTWVYRTPIEAPQLDELLIVEGNGFRLEQTPDLLGFLRAWPEDRLHDVFYANPYLYDAQYRMLYVRKPYAETTVQPGGFLTVTYRNTNGTERTISCTLVLHHIWNAFDEFALLAGLARRYSETNQQLRERIWDRFRFPRHAGNAGVVSRIAQTIGSVRELPWPNPGERFIIPQPRVLPELVVVNGRPLTAGEYQIDQGQRIVLLPRAELGPLTIRYAAGIYARTATPLDIAQNRYDVESVTPRWGHMRYDISFWMPEAMASVRVPVSYDPDLAVWQ